MGPCLLPSVNPQNRDQKLGYKEFMEYGGLQGDCDCSVLRTPYETCSPFSGPSWSCFCVTPKILLPTQMLQLGEEER